MNWLKMVHDCMRRYLPKEVPEMKSGARLISYFKVRGVFYVNFSRHRVAVRPSVNPLFAVVSENLYQQLHCLG